MTVLEKAIKKATAVLEAAQKEYAGLQEQIESYTLKRDAAAAEMERAGDATDLTAYNKAKQDYDDAQTAITMYQNRVAKLETEALLPEEEYNSFCDGIIEETDKYIDDLREEMFTLAEKLEAKHQEANNRLNDANRVLKVLQLDVNRGRDLVYRGNMKNPDASSYKKTGSRDQWEVVQWVGCLPACGTYEQLKKERGK